MQLVNMVAKNRNRQIFMWYIFFVVLYGVVVSFFSSTVHIDVDEELYLGMARSFHYQGKFAIENNVNYSCVLYSIFFIHRRASCSLCD